MEGGREEGRKEACHVKKKMREEEGRERRIEGKKGRTNSPRQLDKFLKLAATPQCETSS
jgi:hypothetical protein